MGKVIVFVDSENFLNKVENVLEGEGISRKKINTAKIKLVELLKTALNEIKIDEVIFYAARLHFHEQTPDRSRELIGRQRALKTELERQGVKFVIAGNVRGQKVDGKTVFKEKGVDVRLAVDMVSMACDKLISTAVLCSSDSDLQPAVGEVKRRGVKVIYLGFEISPNKGLISTTNRTVLFRSAEIRKSLGI